MKKLIAFVAVVGIAVSIAAPVTQDTAEIMYPRPLVATDVEL
ncbi:hypothetical protein [Halobacillus salinus]|nr:hypothetical protein [Halobacillus salinus]